MKRTVLIFSHLVLLALGAWLALPKQQEEAAPPAMSVADPPPAPAAFSPPQAPKSAAAAARVALASPAAWRAAWDEALLGPRAANTEPKMSDSIGFFMDWCEVDPDGAIRGLSKTYAPGFVHNFIGNAVSKHGAILAPVLVKHFRELRLMPGYTVESQMSRALNALAKQDPAQAAALMGSLPPGPRGQIYSGLFERQDREHLDQLLAAMPKPASDYEAQRRGEAYASAVDTADPQQGIWNGMASSDSALRKAFAAEGVRKAERSENWTEFFAAVEKMDSAAREEVRGVVKFYSPSNGYQGKDREAISAECQRLGLEDWTVLPK